MNFQFSGSIPNVHWHSGNNTMSSPSVTEFTILNGRVTVTRAANDTRNDVNVTIVANGRRNEHPRRNCLCHREIRWRNRRRQGLDSLLRSVHDLKDNIYDATDDLSISKRKYLDLKDDLEKAGDEVNKNIKKLIKATQELNRAVNDLQTPQLYSLNEEEVIVLRYDLNLAENEIEEAKRHVEEAQNDLRSTIPAVPSEIVLPEDDSNIPSNSISARSSLTFSANTTTSLRNKCSVCLENYVNSVLYKCGHMCMCYICALKLQRNQENSKCPVCRTQITDVIRTYWS